MVCRLLTLLTVLVLTGCGFHLRSSAEMPPVVQHTVAEGVAPYSELGEALSRSWQQSGASLSFERATSGAARLRITRNQVTRRTLSVDSAGRPREYELSLQVAFSLLDPDGKTLLSNQSLVERRSFQFNPANILAMEDEEIRLRKILAEQAALQIQRRVSFQLRNRPAESESSNNQDTDSINNPSPSTGPDETAR